MQARLHLPAHVRACAAGDWAVFLDLRRNRYWALAASRVALADGRPLAAGRTFETFTSAPALAQRLDEMGLISRTPAPPRAMAAARLPRARRARPWLDLVRALFWAGRIVRTGALERAVADLSARKRAPAGAEASLSAIIDYFDRGRAWFPAPYVCLFDSLALAMFAARRGVPLEVVFGVRGRPFAAHCWLEHEGAVVNDAAEYCAAFTAILRA